MRKISKKVWFGVIGAILILALIWLTLTDNPIIWPIRNTIQYRIFALWGNTQLTADTSGTLQGVVRDNQGQPIEGAWILVARRDGSTYSIRSDATGHYSIGNIPPGTYRPVASAPGFDSVQFGRGLFNQIKIRAEEQTTADVRYLLNQHI